jgi:hypothetical protein
MLAVPFSARWHESVQNSDLAKGVLVNQERAESITGLQVPRGLPRLRVAESA